MKKFISLFIVLVIVVSFSGCFLDLESGETGKISGGTEGEPSAATGESDGGTAAPVETDAATEKPAELSITEQVCFEHDGVKVTAKSITEDSIWGIGIKLLLENNSDKDYSVSTEEVIVNNCMNSNLFSCQIAAGKKANDTLYLSSSMLEAAGITSIGQIEIYFYVYDSSSYERVYEPECTTIKTSLFDTMNTAVDDSGYELFAKDGIRIIGKYVNEDTIRGSSVVLFIENKSNQNITVSCDDMSVNGFMVSSYLSVTVYKGKYVIDDITISSSSLEENEITSIDTIELKFRIYNSDTYDDIIETDPISFSVE